MCIRDSAMGFYDGQGLTTRASAWELADTLGLPVLLVVQPKGASAVSYTHLYLVSTSVMDLLLHLDALDSVAFSGTKAEEMCIRDRTACENVIEAVKAAGYTKVILRPLMVVAGDHANNDMAGEDADSWLSPVSYTHLPIIVFETPPCSQLKI